jgi:hypothetical protein
MTGEESRYVLEEDGGRLVSFHKGKEGEGESRSLTREPPSLSCHGEVLAGEAAGPESSPMPLPTLKVGSAFTTSASRP